MNEVVWVDDAQVTDQDNRKRFVEHETWEAYAAKRSRRGECRSRITICGENREW